MRCWRCSKQKAAAGLSGQPVFLYEVTLEGVWTSKAALTMSRRHNVTKIPTLDLRQPF